MAGIVSTGSFLLAIGFFVEVLGYHTRPLNTLLGLIFLAVFLGPHVSRDPLTSLRSRWPGWLLAAASLVGLLCWMGWVRVLFVSLLIEGIRLSRLEWEPDSDLGVYQATSFFYGVFLWFWRETASGWYVLNGAAESVMWVTRHLGLTATLGPTALGLPVVILLFVYGVVRTLRTPGYRLPTVLKLFAALLVVQIGFVAVYDAVAAALSVTLVQQQAQATVPLWSPFTFLQWLYPTNLEGIAFLLGLAATIAVAPARPEVMGKQKTLAPQRLAVVAGAGALLVGFALAGFVAPRQAACGEVLICDVGYLDFNMPNFRSFGYKSGGMFGRLPSYLKASGYRVKRGGVSRESLKSANVLVVINLMEKFGRSTRRAIWDFVKRGGSLLVLGDHTCTHNIREPLNQLLEPAGISFNFDSAKPFRDGWLYAYGLPRHTMTMGMDDVTAETQVWIGASLSVKPPARPVMIGTTGFSDAGDLANIQEGYLGNLQYDPGERIGDIALVAERWYGKGRVMVFGDTSSLQNEALVYSHRFTDNMFSWLSSPQRRSTDLARRTAASLLILAGICLLAMRANTRAWTSIATAAFLLGWGLGAVPAKVLNAPSAAHNDIAWIDASHLEQFSLNSWVDEGLGGLTFNLMRSGYSPLLMRNWDARALARGSLLILIGPSKPLSQSEINSVRKFVQDGGNLILAAGWEDRLGSAKLWEEFGLRVQERPLGRVLVKQPGGDVRLYRGWSIKVLSGDPEVLCSPWGFPAIVRMRVGKGSVVAIADTQFLLDRNLEGTQEYYPENIEFLRKLFVQLNPGRTGVVQTGAPSSPAHPGSEAETRRLPVPKGGR